MEDLVLVAHVASTLTMVGIIWFVQIVHYPLLAIVPVENASSVALDHQRRTGYVVALPMALEGITTLALLAMVPSGVAWFVPWLAGVPLAVALGVTVLVSVPLHERMARQPDDSVGARLVRTNWIRTVAWSVHGVFAVAMLSATLAAKT